MKIGVPKEIKVHEYRVAMVPAGVRELTGAGHEVFVERDAGRGAGFENDQYLAAGAQLLPTAAEIFKAASLIVKVKEPQLEECARLTSSHTLFTYLHLAADPKQAKALLRSGTTAVAYETVVDADRTLPLLTPMSEVAGRMAIQVGASCLQRNSNGMGVLLGGVPGVAPARVVILGGGVAGTHAAIMAMGMEADVTVVDRSVKRLRELSSLYGARLKTVYSTADSVEQLVMDADLVIGTVLIVGAAAPKLVSREMVKRMKAGSVVVDVAIDQGGCFETSKPTTHDAPTFVVDSVVHYCVANMPGAVPRSSTLALTNATFKYVKAIADLGWDQAAQVDAGLAQGLNIRAGKITHGIVARDLAGMV